jgi:hypothetical protein
MSNLSPELKKAIKNVETYKFIISEKLQDTERKAALLSLVDSVEETLILAPASTRIEYHGAFVGGLVEQSLNVLKTMSVLNKAYETSIPTDSLVVTGLFYDIGKVGDGKTPYYLAKQSDWHNQQGIMYEVNPNMISMPVSLRSLFLLQDARVRLTSEEHYAISTVKDRVRQSDESLPTTHEPFLAVVLQQAIRITSLKGSGRTSIVI